MAVNLNALGLPAHLDVQAEVEEGLEDITSRLKRVSHVLLSVIDLITHLLRIAFTSSTLLSNGERQQWLIVLILFLKVTSNEHPHYYD